MEVTILGSGTVVPSLRRASSGYAVRTAETLILLDGGSGTVGRMTRFGVDFRAVNAICYTHTHADHTADFVPFLYALNYTPDFARTEPLWVFGPEGFSNFAAHLEAAWPSMKPKGYELLMRELKDDVFQFRDLRVATAPTQHGEDMPSIAYRITGEGRSIVYSGDTTYTSELVQLARNTDLLVIEASFPADEFKQGQHLSAEEAGRIAQEAGAKKVLLTHLYPICDKYDMRDICAKEFSGEIVIAEDGTCHSLD